MKLKDAYKQGLIEELKPLIDSGKVTLLGTLEEVVEDIVEAIFKGVKKGAVLSEDKWDDMIVPPAADFLESRIKPYVDKIHDEESV